MNIMGFVLVASFIIIGLAFVICIRSDDSKKIGKILICCIISMITIATLCILFGVNHSIDNEIKRYEIVDSALSSKGYTISYKNEDNNIKVTTVSTVKNTTENDYLALCRVSWFIFYDTSYVYYKQIIE